MITRIKQILEKRNLPPSRFADQIGVPRSTISHILSGRNNPSLEVVQKILNAFPDIPVEWLLQGKGTYSQQSYTLFDTDDELPDRESGTEISEDIGDQIDTVNLESSVADEKMEAAQDERTETPSSIIKDRSSGHAEKLIIIYSDGTFKEYKPSV